MEQKMIKKICFVAIGFFIILAIIEIIIRGATGKFQKLVQKREDVKKEEQMYRSEKQAEQRQVTNFLNDIFEAILDFDDKYVFDALDVNYRKYAFKDDRELLKEYLKENFNTTDKYEYIRVNQDNGMYQVLVGVTNGDKYSSFTVTVKIKDTNSCTLMFGEYSLLEKFEIERVTDLVDYKVSYYYETPDVEAYVIDFENKTAQDVSVETLNSSKLVMKNGEVLNSLENISITLKPNETIREEIAFVKQFGGKSYLQINLKENQVEKEFVISLERNNM